MENLVIRLCKAFPGLTSGEAKRRLDQFEQQGVTQDEIEYALDQATRNNARSVNYLNGVIRKVRENKPASKRSDVVTWQAVDSWNDDHHRPWAELGEARPTEAQARADAEHMRNPVIIKRVGHDVAEVLE